MPVRRFKTMLTSQYKQYGVLSGRLLVIPSALGGDTTEAGGYRIHSFATVGSFSFNAQTNLNVEYLIIAGGGGGSNRHKGGGGAGGYLSGSFFKTPEPYNVVVGTGGNGASETVLPSVNFGTNGGNSSIFGLTSTGGGASDSPGGSGGGGGSGSAGSLGTPGQGNQGGAGSYTSGGHVSESSYTGGGGGGAGSVGVAATSVTPSRAGNGGAGLSSSITGSSVIRAGGGGGGAAIGSVDAGSGWGSFGGSGGGGNGGRAGAAQSATPNTGSGGGAGGFSATSNFACGNGGSGIIVIRYLNQSTYQYD